MHRDPSCVFCRIVAVEIPAAIIHEDQYSLAFLDIAPLSEGHTLLIPKEHYARLTDIPPDYLEEMCSVIPRLGRALTQLTGAAGFNLLANDGAVAGQVVPHTHFHLIPRRPGDDLGYRWNAGSYPPGRQAALAAQFRDLLSKHV